MADTTIAASTTTSGGKDPRVFYRTEGKRTIAVVFNYDRSTRELRYGASIFRADDDESRKKLRQRATRKSHRMTALGRLNKNPVVVHDFQDTEKIDQFNDKVRKLLLTHGVCDHSKSTPATPAK